MRTWQPGDRRMVLLNQGVRVRRNRARAEIASESALPAGLFDCQEPTVEAALVDAAAGVLRATLGQRTPAPPHDPDFALTTEHVTDVAVTACIAQFTTLAADPVPDLMAGLDDERLWVLLDLARRGTGVTRQRATLQVRQALRWLAAHCAEKQALLADLAAKLEALIGKGQPPVLFCALLLEARAALQRVATARTGVEVGPR